MPLLPLLALLLAWLTAAPALANTPAVFNGGAVAGCTYTAASSSYSCPPFAATLDVTIASGYKVVLTGPISFDYNQQLNMSGTAQLQVAGNLDIGDIKPSNLNISGGALVSSGQFKMGAQVQTIVADISAASMKIGTGSDTKVTGTLTSTGQIDLASHATIIGPITGGKITTGSPVALTGDVTASISFNLSSGSTLNGNLVAPVVTLDASPSRVNGNVTANTSLTISSASSVNGNVVAGAVKLLSSDAYITGTALVDTLDLDWHGRVYQAVTCRTGTAGSPCSCVTDGSGYASTPSKTVCTAPAANTVHHYQITHDGNGLTCQPETVSVKACADASCSTLYTGSAQVSLAPNTVESPAPVFSFSNGVASAYVRQTTVGTPTLAITSATPAATAAATCSSPSGTSCSMAFAAAGFQVTAADRKAGVSAPFIVQALTASNNNVTPSSCVPLIANTTKTLQMRCAYIDPTTNSNTLSRAVNLTGAGGAGNTPSAALVCGSGSGGLASAAGANLSLSFDGNGVSTNGALSYDDVGSLALSAEYTASNANFTGSSTDFVVAPHHYAITNASTGTVSNPGASSATEGVFTSAGTPFSVQVTVLSQNNVVSTNFGRETLPPRVDLTRNLVAPLPSPAQPVTSAGTLTLPSPAVITGAIVTSATATNPTPGKFTISNLSWDEVGIITLTATTNNALNNGSLYSNLNNALVGSGTSGNIGRFIPDHFDTAITTPNASPIMVCPTGVFSITCSGGRFVYASQPFGLTVSARNAAGALTTNYAGSYARPLAITAWNAAGATGTAAPNDNDNPEYRPVDNAARSMPTGPGLTGGPAVPTPFVFTGGNGLGSISYAFSKSYSPGPPYMPSVATNTISSPVNVFFRAAETTSGGDGVTSLRAGAVEAGIAVASGRLQVAHSYGSALLTRRVEVESQYWTGTEFLRNSADATAGTTALSTTNVLTFGNCTRNLSAGGGCYAGLAADSTPATVAFTLGRSWLRLAAPGGGRAGSVGLRGNAFPWLPSTVGRLNYGVYRSPVIYLREIH
jgi:MSHA biogenesis protein MshQ